MRELLSYLHGWHECVRDFENVSLSSLLSRLEGDIGSNAGTGRHTCICIIDMGTFELYLHGARTTEYPMCQLAVIST